MVLHAFVADVHVTNPARFGGPMGLSMNERCRMILHALGDAYALARKHSANTFSILGDLFDNPNPNPRMVAAVQSIFEERTASPWKCQRRVMTGNHDPNSSHPGDHALAPLYQQVNVIDGPEVFDYKAYGGKRASFMYVPFISGDYTAWLRTIVEDLRSDTPKCVLCFHAGIKDKNTPPWLAGGEDTISVEALRSVMGQHRIQRVFCGHWHNHCSWDDNHIVQVGALCPTGWNNPGLEGYGSVVFFNEDTDEVWREEVPGPRFIKVHAGNLAECAQMLEPTAAAKAAGNTLFLQLVVPQDRVKEFARIKDEHHGRYHVVEIVPDRTDAEVAARNAAQAAKSVDGLGRATVAYVNEMHLEEGVPRKNVLRTTRRYLNV